MAIVLFNFPPNSGAMGTAAHLSVFESLFNSLSAMKQAGYDVDLPESAEVLRDTLLTGNAEEYGAEANVHATISVDDHVANEPYLEEIERSGDQHLEDIGRTVASCLFWANPSAMSLLACSLQWGTRAIRCDCYLKAACLPRIASLRFIAGCVKIIRPMRSCTSVLTVHRVYAR